MTRGPHPKLLLNFGLKIANGDASHAINDGNAIITRQAPTDVTLVLTTSGAAIIRKSLRELLGSLDDSEFWHVHRSVIVRVSAIDCVRRDELGKWWLTLKGHGKKLPVSAAFQGRLRGM